MIPVCHVIPAVYSAGATIKTSSSRSRRKQFGPNAMAFIRMSRCFESAQRTRVSIVICSPPQSVWRIAAGSHDPLRERRVTQQPAFGQFISQQFVRVTPIHLVVSAMPREHVIIFITTESGNEIAGLEYMALQPGEF